eukprot:CAMPEP_0195294708 /NCGR_PEP_ID=MMETSP0707-20130614/15728_1 /TAXON_ID=33640 /ORGANISM="Asterionellopsis glacialis, Strain CCMP134" /LENGTH=50 /DNA_ID=CAMNT_0040355751 /DNA_START=182 /DNA_END=334 /DNA_ORIENTATION=+
MKSNIESDLSEAPGEGNDLIGDGSNHSGGATSAGPTGCCTGSFEETKDIT